MSEQNPDPILPESDYDAYSALLHEMQNFLSDETAEKADSSVENFISNEITISNNQENVAIPPNLTTVEQIPLPNLYHSENQEENLTEAKTEFAEENTEQPAQVVSPNSASSIEMPEMAAETAIDNALAEQFQLVNDCRTFVQNTEKNINDQSARIEAKNPLSNTKTEDTFAVFDEIQSSALNLPENDEFAELGMLLLAEDEAGNADSKQTVSLFENDSIQTTEAAIKNDLALDVENKSSTFVLEQLGEQADHTNLKTNLSTNATTVDDSKDFEKNTAEFSNGQDQDSSESLVVNPLSNLDDDGNLVAAVKSAENNIENQILNQTIAGEMVDSGESSESLDDFDNFGSLPLLLMEEEKEIPLPDLTLEEAFSNEEPIQFETNQLQVPESLALAVSPGAALKQSENVAITPQKFTKSTTISLDLHERYIVFRLDDKFYALAAANIVEIGHPLPVTLLPFVPAWFLGIANLRGDILSIIGLRELWNIKSTVQQKAKMLILRSLKINLTIGVIVDGVREMRRVPDNEIQSIEDNSEDNSNDQINCKTGIADYDGQTLHLLDAEQLLASLKV